LTLKVPLGVPQRFFFGFPFDRARHSFLLLEWDRVSFPPLNESLLSHGFTRRKEVIIHFLAALPPPPADTSHRTRRVPPPPPALCAQLHLPSPVVLRSHCFFTLSAVSTFSPGFAERSCNQSPLPLMTLRLFFSQSSSMTESQAPPEALARPTSSFFPGQAILSFTFGQNLLGAVSIWVRHSPFSLLYVALLEHFIAVPHYLLYPSLSGNGFFTS